jgi:hypothetical protein
VCSTTLVYIFGMSCARIMGDIISRSLSVQIPSQTLTESLPPFSSSPNSQQTTPASLGNTTTTSTRLVTHHTTFHSSFSDIACHSPISVFLSPLGNQETEQQEQSTISQTSPFSSQQFAISVGQAFPTSQAPHSTSPWC